MGSWETRPFGFSKHSTAKSATTTTASEFLAGASIAQPVGDAAPLVPFGLWPAQQAVLARLEADRLVVLLKARQIGMTWLTCGYALWRCMERSGRTVLLFSQGQLEANELIERIRLMHTTHADRSLPALVTDNTTELQWANGSRIKSLPATRKAGRSFTASLVILDEYAFMQWGAELLAAVKPTIDNGGQLVILSSADGNGTPFHQFWRAASEGSNGFTPLFLDWTANPTRTADWRDARMVEGVSASDVLREYPANDIEAFTHATGLVYDVWADGPEDGNVTAAADYIPNGGEIVWAVDDGYEGRLDLATGLFTANSAPRVFLLIQVRPDGRLCVFEEHYEVKVLPEEHIRRVLALPYPEPDYAVVDSAAAELRGRLHAAEIANFGKPDSIEESIKTTQRMLAPDQNGVRRVLVHPRCKHLRSEFASYRRDDRGKPVDAFNHGLDALRYLCWKARYD